MDLSDQLLEVGAVQVGGSFDQHIADWFVVRIESDVAILEM